MKLFISFLFYDSFWHYPLWARNQIEFRNLHTSADFFRCITPQGEWANQIPPAKNSDTSLLVGIVPWLFVYLPITMTAKWANYSHQHNSFLQFVHSCINRRKVMNVHLPILCRITRIPHYLLHVESLYSRNLPFPECSHGAEIDNEDNTGKPAAAKTPHLLPLGTSALLPENYTSSLETWSPLLACR